MFELPVIVAGRLAVAGRRTAPPQFPYYTAGETMWTFVLWLILLVVSWPLALLALLLYPFVWLLLLPFRLVGITVDAVFRLLKAILLLPARVLGGPSRVRA